MKTHVETHRRVILAAVLTPFCLGVVERAAAEDPAGCSLAGTSVLMTLSPSGPVDHGDTICYTVCYGAPAFPSCNITDFSADLFFPDGSSVNVVSGASIDVGTQFCCGFNFNDPADPRCVAHSDADYCYTVDHGDEVESFTGCPPVPSGDSGKVVAYTHGSGVAQTPQVDAVAPCATAHNGVIHGACCEPCTGTCTDGVTANECPTDSNFMPGMLCSEIECSLDCNDGIACSADCCFPWDRSDPDPANWVAAFCTNTSFCEDTSCDEGSTPQVCEDNDVCTQDSCDDTAVGCCLFEDIPCDPRECFNNTGCDPVAGCQYESICVADPNFCDDSDVCTMDTCDDTVGGCCIHNDIPCEPRACFDLTGCDPVSGCTYEPVVCANPICEACNPSTGVCELIVPEPPGCGEHCCRITGGGMDCDTGAMDEDCTGASGQLKKDDGIDVYTYGGQAGAPGAEFGEWTHVNHSGPSGSWVFHAGTSSAPNPGTMVEVVRCSDEPACHPARANGPNKQIDFAGVGSFRNITVEATNGTTDGIIPHETLCPFSVHIEDLGEPGRSGKQHLNKNKCPLGGHEGLSVPLDDCKECPDFYHITIWDPTGANVIYDSFGYVRNGNLQMHQCLDHGRDVAPELADPGGK